MITQEAVDRVTATSAARRAIAHLSRHHRPVLFVQSTGCPDGAPGCYRSGQFTIGDTDELLGVIDGAPFYIDVRLYDACGRPPIVLDVEAGPADKRSLAAGRKTHFTSRTVPPGADRAGARKGPPGPRARGRTFVIRSAPAGDAARPAC